MARGEICRNLELPDLRIASLNFEPQNVPAVAMAAMNGKTNVFGKTLFTAMARSKRPEICGIGMLGFYFFYRWHVTGEPFPDLATREAWYTIKVLKGKTPTTAINYNSNVSLDCCCIRLPWYPFKG